MKKIWILFLCFTGIALAEQEPKSLNEIPGPTNLVENKEYERGIRRFACPVGFFRLKRFCYYLSGGKATWWEAHFHCRDRNSTLSVLDKRGKDKMLRRYLMGEQFVKLDRWIDGIYNYKQKIWTWGTSGKQIGFQSFYRHAENPMIYSCITMDPNSEYKWKADNCSENKHFVCEVHAGGMNRRRKKTIDPYAPENQRLRAKKKDKKNNLNKERKPKKYRRNRGKNAVWKREWMQQNPHQEWRHGVKLGSRPPSGIRLAPGAMPSDRMRHHPIDRKFVGSVIPSVSQISAQGKNYGAFLGDSPVNSHREHSLSSISNALNEYQEEVLLKT